MSGRKIFIFLPSDGNLYEGILVKGSSDET
jgi:hypothetical protein